MEGKDGNLKPETFRDRMVTVDEEGKRKWIFPKKPKGKLFNRRSWLSYFNLIVLFGLPWITYKGHPFVLLNIIERKFILLWADILASRFLYRSVYVNHCDHVYYHVHGVVW